MSPHVFSVRKEFTPNAHITPQIAPLNAARTAAAHRPYHVRLDRLTPGC